MRQQGDLTGTYLLCEWALTEPYESVLWYISEQLNGTTYLGEYVHSEHEDSVERDLTFASGQRVIFIESQMATRMTIFEEMHDAREAMTERFNAVLEGGRGGDRKADQ